MGIAKYVIKVTIDIQFPTPLEQVAIGRLPNSAKVFNLIAISKRFVRNEKSGARGKTTAKKAMKPIYITASL